MTEYITSVGMEVHTELLTKSKMFCGCAVDFGGEPNTRCCPTCLGLPGALPVMNLQAVEHVARTAIALNCEIPRTSIWHRKNYFYPDLPKGYQISQYENTPIGINGYLEILVNGEVKKVKIRRAHLEEDTGKLMHLRPNESEVDFNRSGVPLLEIVTEFPPDINSAEEAREYLTMLRATLMYLGVSDGKMQEGSLRCEPNISIRPMGSDEFGVKSEIKNLGSFRAVTRGIEYEVERMKEAISRGETQKQETRGWNETQQRTYLMRTKESEQDYRYFREPDLMSVHFDDAWLDRLRATMPELPVQKRLRYMNELGLSDYDSSVLTAELETAQFFEKAIDHGADPKLATNWITGDFSRLLNEKNKTINDSPITPSHIAELVKLISSGAVNGKQAKSVFEDSYKTGKMPSQLVKEAGVSQITDEESIRALLQNVMDANPDVLEKIASGNVQPKGFLVGQTMKQSQGRANPQLVAKLLDEELAKR